MNRTVLVDNPEINFEPLDNHLYFEIYSLNYNTNVTN